MRSLFKSKKGDLNDTFFTLLVFFVFILMTALAYTGWIFVDDAFQSLDDSIVEPHVKVQLSNLGNIFFTLDGFVPFFLIALWIGTIVNSITVRPDHPSFFIFSMIVLFFFTIVIVIFADFGIEMFDNTIVGDFIGDLKSINFIMHKFHFIGFFMMLMSNVIFFSRIKREASDIIQ